MLYHLGQLLGGIVAYRLSKRLKVTSSTNTFLRLICRFASMPNQAVRVLGVDDWAICKRTNYGTILVDLERHQVVDLLPGCTTAVLAGWLTQRSGIEIVAGDRTTEYARGITAGAPQAMQVADRWHLLQPQRPAGVESAGEMAKSHLPSS
jgi:transposase